MVATKKQFIEWRLKCLCTFGYNNLTTAEQVVLARHKATFEKTGDLSPQSFAGLEAMYMREQKRQFDGAPPVVHSEVVVNRKTGLTTERAFTYPSMMYKHDQAARV